MEKILAHFIIFCFLILTTSQISFAQNQNWMFGVLRLYGLFIDPSFPDGNFFSDDGINPTATGNAVIANETINVINKDYKIRIPLINVSELTKRLRSKN